MGRLRNWLRRQARRAAKRILHFAEVLFLWSYGWKRDGKDGWFTPPGYQSPRGHSLPHGHAVNSQKFWMRNQPFAPKRRKPWIP